LVNEYPAESRAMSSVAENVSVIAAGPDAVLMLLGVILNPVRRGGTLSPANNEVSWRRNAVAFSARRSSKRILLRASDVLATRHPKPRVGSGRQVVVFGSWFRSPRRCW
jgi:hypothetical protein